jgi:hypothetical protein
MNVRCKECEKENPNKYSTMKPKLFWQLLTDKATEPREVFDDIYPVYEIFAAYDYVLDPDDGDDIATDLIVSVPDIYNPMLYSVGSGAGGTFLIENNSLTSDRELYVEVWNPTNEAVHIKSKQKIARITLEPQRRELTQIN